MSHDMDDGDRDPTVRATEERLRELLHRAAPPARPLDPDALVARASRRTRPGRLLLPAAVLVTVLAVVVAVVLGVVISRPDDTGPPSAPTTAAPTAATATPTVTTTGTATTTSPAPTSGTPTTSGAPGTTTTVGPAGGPVPTGFAPNSATFVSADHGWVLGNAPCSSPPCTSVVRTRDGGRTWVGIPAPRTQYTGFGSGQADGSGAGVSAVRFADDAHGWAFGPGVWATADGGTSWRPVSLPGRVSALQTGGGTVVAVVSVSADRTEIWGAPVAGGSWRQLAVAASENLLLTMTGATWFAIGPEGLLTGTGVGSAGKRAGPCPTQTAAVALTSPRPADVDVICAGAPGAGASEQQLFGSDDGGRTWNAGGPPRLAPSVVAGISDNGAGVLLVARSSGGAVMDRTEDFGADFDSVLRGPASGGVPWSDLGFTTTTQAMVVQASTAMFLSRDSGRTWSRVQFG